MSPYKGLIQRLSKHEKVPEGLRYWQRAVRLSKTEPIEREPQNKIFKKSAAATPSASPLKRRGVQHHCISMPDSQIKYLS